MIEIRKAVKDDIEQFKEVAKTSIMEFCKDFYAPDQINALLGQFPEHDLYSKWIEERVLIVAESNGRIVGFAQYNPDISHIEAVHVLPSYAFNGVGKRLVNKIEEIATSQGATKINLGSSLNAMSFYEKCGYKRKESSKYLCKNGVELETVTYEKIIT